MMLTDEQIKDAVSDAKLSDYWYSHGDLLVLFARSIEAAVREEQAGEIARLKEELSIAKIGVRHLHGEIDLLENSNIELREANAELLEALGDLSFACFGGLGTCSPSVVVYNATFAVLQRHRELIAKHGGK
jgi:hypothetical protein